MSLILGIETAGESVGCAVGRLSKGEVKILASFEKAEPKKHCENLVPLVEKSLKEGGAAVEDLDLIVVNVGPGLYTGLRVGIATAQFLTYALRANGKETKCIGISSLDLLAFQFSKNNELEKATTLFSVIDAKRGEVFHASYKEQKFLSGEKSVTKPQELAEKIQKLEGEKICVGGGAMLYADIFEGAGSAVKDEALSAEALVYLSATFNLQSHIPPEDLQPIYLRKPDVQ